MRLDGGVEVVPPLPKYGQNIHILANDIFRTNLPAKSQQKEKEKGEGEDDGATWKKSRSMFVGEWYMW